MEAPVNIAAHAPLPPGPRGGLLGSLRAVQEDTLAFLVENALQYGGFYRFRAGSVPVYLAAAPEAVRRVLVDNASNYSKNTFTYRGTVSIIGHSVFNSDGDVWLRKRRILQPVFQPDRLGMLDTIVAESCKRATVRWRAGEVDAAGEMVRVALEVASHAFFGIDMEGESQAIGEAVTTLANTFTRRYTSAAAALWGLVNVPLASNREVVHAKQTLYAAVDRILAEQQERGAQESLTAALFATADPQSGAKLSPSELRSELLTLLIAGHETTAAALAWTWQMLAWHPDAQERVRDEVTGLLGDGPATLADLPRLPLLRMVLDEALRLYPPAWGFTRRAEQDDEIMGYLVPKGARLIVSPYVAHRLPDIWEQPEAFVPERFTPEATQVRSPYAYIPFGAGPRQCIGRRFALIEAQLVLANLLRRFSVAPVDPAPVLPVAHATLRPLQPIHLRVSEVGQPTQAR